MVSLRMPCETRFEATLYTLIGKGFMFRSTVALVVLTIGLAGFASAAQDRSAALQTYFTGKEVVMKLDMPGSQKGVDLRFNNNTPMNWKEYSSRIKQFGTAIHKGDTARITSIVVKKDTIEFQLDGGGFGTFGDDTSTTVKAKVIDKTDYEKQLEQQIQNTDDPTKKAQLQKDLDRERARRERQNAQNESNAKIASSIKADQVAGKRAQGGSRFNLRWSGSIPPAEMTPDAVMKLLAEYVDFSPIQGGDAAPTAPGTPAPAGGADAAAVSPAAQLKRGMKIDEVAGLLGQGRQLSESTTSDGLKSQVYEYLPGDQRVEVTYVEGVVVKYSISSR